MITYTPTMPGGAGSTPLLAPRQTRRRGPFWLVLLALLGVGASACGDSGDDEHDAQPRRDATSSDAAVRDSGAVDAAQPDAALADAQVHVDGTSPDGGQADGGVTETPATIVQLGVSDKVLLRGLVVTPSQAFAGEVLVEGDLITCVAPSCAAVPGAATASVVETGGILFPGLINTHDHVLFDVFDADDWAPSQAYGNHNQWISESRYLALSDARQYLNGEGASPIDLNCELNKYGEIKQLIAGTTSIVGAASPANKACYRTLARTIDQTANGLCGTSPPQSCPDSIQVASMIPSTAVADGVCANFTSGSTDAYLVHIGEGVDATARAELNELYTVSTVDGCLFDPRTTIVHGSALLPADLDLLATSGMGLSWSPRSDVTLYGAGVDFTKTADIPAALARGINVSLGTTWSITGSANLLDELRFADAVDNAQWGDVLTPQMLVEMVTLNAAAQLAVDGQLGSLEVGKKADLMVIGGDPSAPYQALLEAHPADVRLVMVDGVTLYGDGQLQPLGPATPGCETLTICGRPKFLCVALPGGTATDKFGQTWADIEAALSAALASYDALDLSPWDFSPLAPLATCP